MIKDLTILQGRLKYIFRQSEAEGANPLGQQLANELNTTVKAPNEYLWFSSNGKLTPLISCKQHPERNEKMTNFISTGSTYWISDEEIHILEENATNGDKNSAFKLYQYHMFVSLDQDLEFKWLEIAAENGHPIAQSNLADLFFTQNNKEKAIFWAKKAHRNGAKLPEVASQSNQNGTT